MGEKEKKNQESKKEPVMLYASSDVQRDINRAIDRITRDFEDFFDLPKRHGEIAPWRSEMPFVDIEDREKDFFVTVDMPGFKKEELNIEVTDDYVTIQAAKGVSKEEEDKKKRYVRKERAAESYFRKITFPQEINSNQAQANLNDGILQITLPKKELVETKKLTIA